MKTRNMSYAVAWALAALMLGASTLARGQSTDLNVARMLDAESIAAEQQAKANTLRTKLAQAERVTAALVANLERLKQEGARDEVVQGLTDVIERRKAEIEELTGTLELAAQRLSANELAASDGSSTAVDQVKELVAEFEGRLREFETRAAAPKEPLPEILNSVTVVYTLRNAQAQAVADVLLRLFGPGQIRTAIGEDQSRLIVLSEPMLEEQVRELVQSLDSPPTTEEVVGETGGSDHGPQSLLVRIFWVADHLPEGEGQELANFLPTGVIEAFENLGLESPRVVAQTVNSVARPANDRSPEPVTFATTTQVISSSIASTQLQSKGIATLNNKGRVDLNVEIVLSGGTNCQVAGTITAPLGHYVVLGTANSMVLDPKNAAAGVTVDQATAQGIDGGGRAGMGFDGGRGYDPGMGGMPFGGTLPPSMKSSRIAFVVQVIENASYAMHGNE
jgi:hypothetical protein